MPVTGALFINEVPPFTIFKDEGFPIFTLVAFVCPITSVVAVVDVSILFTWIPPLNVSKTAVVSGTNF